MKLGVIGAGVIGKGVALRFAKAKAKVFLLDIDQAILDKARTDMARELRCMKMMGKKLEDNEIMENIQTTLSYTDLAEVEFIVENVPENLEIKKGIYKNLENVCKSDCIYMANTSCIPITFIGSLTNRPDRVIGVHFMNPVVLKDFAEVIRGQKTSDKTVSDTEILLEAAGMTLEVIQDSAGFVSNRLSHLFMNEAAFLVHEGVASPNQIDNIMKKAFGHAMGPLETADLIGLDTVLNSLKILYDQYEDPKFRACPMLKRLVYSGAIGRKSGKGFYSYDNS